VAGNEAVCRNRLAVAGAGDDAAMLGNQPRGT
jgi:hypothetical protein